MKVGGRVAWLLEPATPEEFREAYLLARERGHQVRVLGGGANLLVCDGELPFTVLCTSRMGRIFRPGTQPEDGADGAPESGSTADPEREPAPLAQLEDLARVAPVPREDDPRLVAWAGASLPGLLRTARELGWSGLEGLVGVPGSAGGAAAMNAGGRWGDFWDVVESVRVLTPEGELRDITRAAAKPSYRDGGLGENIVLGVVLALEVSQRAEVSTVMDTYLREKNALQPVTEASSGCIFKNPDPELSDGRRAGQLIDECGGKELRRGAALVSPRHANFIINSGGAQAADVFTLIEDVRDLVAQKTGLQLATEVRIWP
jgi:UDP-N-acetylmuramate dehydrogenase